MPGWRDIPALVRHSTVAIYGKSFAGQRDGFIRALRVSRDTLAKQGYVYHGANVAVLQNIRLTGKGWLRNQKHLMEGFRGQAKDLEFARLWKTIEPRIWELDGPGGSRLRAVYKTSRNAKHPRKLTSKLTVCPEESTLRPSSGGSRI